MRGVDRVPDGGTVEGWRREQTRSVAFRGVTVGYDRMVRPDGRTRWYPWLDVPDSVTVVAVTDKAEVVFVEEYRPFLGERVLSCPVGGVESGESFAEAGARELREETGYRAGRAVTLGTHYSVSWLRRRRGVVFAEGLTRERQDLERGEFVDVRLVPAEEALDVARENPATEWTLSALLLTREEGLL